MVNGDTHELKFHSPAGIIAIWLDALGEITGHDQEKVLLTLDYNKEHKLEHIKASDPEDKQWEQHFRRRK